ncbi:MAG: hypothetical protein ACTHJT_14270 [Cytophaga sp.]|uniref:hypothetical protein n=1 Tax=Cytophaga sp. TaxID=29535 RepID=UPI003F7EC716
MVFKEDITTRITADFGQEASEAIRRLHAAVSKTVDLNTDRIIRCIVFLAAGNLTTLDKHIKAAALDPRDVMLWAEYEVHGDNPKRIRDFNKTFEASSEDIHE